MTRAESRRGFDMTTRVSLIETDLDTVEAALVAHQSETKAEMEKLVASVEAQTDSMREMIATNTKVLVGILSAVIAALVMLVVNIALKAIS